MVREIHCAGFVLYQCGIWRYMSQWDIIRSTNHSLVTCSKCFCAIKILESYLVSLYMPADCVPSAFSNVKSIFWLVISLLILTGVVH